MQDFISMTETLYSLKASSEEWNSQFYPDFYNCS